jgi:mannitol 2-dehydrogenase
LIRYLLGPDDPEAVLEALTAPSTRIVSLTITEGGYGIDDSTGEFDPQDELTRKAVVSFARARDPALADWIEASVSFPRGGPAGPGRSGSPAGP